MKKMQTKTTRLPARCLFAAIVVAMFSISRAIAATPAVSVTENTNSIPRYDIYEVTMAHAGTYSNPWDDVNITAVFTSPSAKTYTIGGFYYDTNTWKLRFAPMETGTWTWSLTFDNGAGQYTTNGTLSCTASGHSGFLRVGPQNHKNFITEADGKLFPINGYNIGYTNPSNLSPMTGLVDANKPAFRLPILDIFNTYRRAGLDIYRCNLQQLTYLSTFNSGGTGKNIYSISEGKRQDELLEAVHQSGLKLMQGFFPFNLKTDCDYWSNPGDTVALRAYHKHMLNRFSAYVDIWELGNEWNAQSTNEAANLQTYLNTVPGWVATDDPYQHPLTISYQQQSMDESGLTAANSHTYRGGSNLILDQQLVTSSGNSVKTGLGIQHGAMIAGQYIPGMRECYPDKPIYMGECGNSSPTGNYDPERYRIFLWTTLMNESGPIFWLRIDTKFTTQSGGYSNTYIGSEERSMARAWANLARGLDPLIELIPVTPSSDMRVYAMGSDQNIIGYALHASSHTTDLSDGQVTLTIPADGMQGQWVDPATGTILQNFTVNSGSQTLTVPTFQCDIAFRIKTAVQAPRIEFSSASYLAQESQSAVTVAVTRTVSSTGAVSVAYTTGDGLAQAGTSYTAVSGTLNWADGDMNAKSIVIPLQDDHVITYDKDLVLTLSDPSGAVIGNNETALVTVFEAFTTAASFTAAPASGWIPLTVTFTDTSLGTVTNRLWDFGDGTTTNTADSVVTHTYTAVGTNTVTLIAVGPIETNTNTQPACVTATQPVAPVAGFAASPHSGLMPLEVSFTDTSAGDVTNRFWDFGDGSTLVTASSGATHTYTNAGVFSVMLAVDGPAGSCTNIQANLISVQLSISTNMDITANAADTYITESATPSVKAAGTSPVRVGDDSSNNRYTSVFPFQLPELAPGVSITEVTLHLYAEAKTSFSSATDVYLDILGGRVASLATVVATDATNTTAVLASSVQIINKNVVVPFAADHVLDPAFFRSIYNSDPSAAGKFVFIVLRTSKIDPAGANSFISYTTADAAANKPVLSITATGSAGGGGNGGDTDGDEIPDSWETQYFGGTTNANAAALSANGRNTIREAYIAGLDPTNAASRFEVSNVWNRLSWNAVSGRVYSVYWTTNLLNGFQPLETNIVWPQNSWTGQVGAAQGGDFYQLKVQLAP